MHMHINPSRATSDRGDFIPARFDDSHLWGALRYVELNPVRAGLVAVSGTDL
jgi:hypothetical protein